MKTCLACLVSGLLLAVCAQVVRAQAAALKGVVWEIPGDAAQAEEELQRMHAAGVEAVRTGLVRDEALLALADTLGLQLFQDLPAAYLGAGALRDTLGAIERTLAEALLLAQGHPSARHFGLARYGDTSDPAACAYVEALARRVRRTGPHGSQAYYLTRFVEADRCAGAVDLVLLGALNRADPGALLERWRAAHPGADSTAVGLGALGTWVDEEAGRGLRVPHSPEAQARYLERLLSALLDPQADTAAAVVFVYRWADRAAQREGEQENASGRSYGLHGPSGPRPALAVVRGLFTGTQTVFAFPAGEAPPQGLPWMVLLGWGVIGALSVFYASAPRFRRMVLRYFRARGFYREAVREGRDVLTGASVMLLVGISVSAGLIMAEFLLAVRDTLPFVALMQWLAAPARERVIELLEHPWMLVVPAGALYAAGLLAWTLLLALATRRRFPLRPEQTLMLVVWPRWPLLVLMVAAVVASTLPPPQALPVALGLLAAWLLLALSTTARTLYDVAALARLPSYLTLVLACASPLALLVVAGAFVALEHTDRTALLWHLATRG